MNKMRNIITEIDGIKFQSKKEANRYLELKLLEHSGQIKNLRLQVSFEIVSGEHTATGRAIKYKPDFVYVDIKTGVTIYEDVKGRKAGTQYRLFLLKKALMKERYNIDVIEV